MIPSLQEGLHLPRVSLPVASSWQRVPPLQHLGWVGQLPERVSQSRKEGERGMTTRTKGTHRRQILDWRMSEATDSTLHLSIR